MKAKIAIGQTVEIKYYECVLCGKPIGPDPVGHTWGKYRRCRDGAIHLAARREHMERTGIDVGAVAQ